MNKILLLVIILLFSTTAFSAVKTWDGGGADANWQTAANWVNDIAPVANDDLVLPATAAQLTTNNNFFLLTNFNSITIDGNYIIGGNPLRIANNLTVNSGTPTISTAISLNGGQTFNAAQGSITTIVVLSVSGAGLTIDGIGSFAIGLISGSGGIIKNGAGASLLASASSFNGAIAVNNGIFVVDANIPNSAVTVNNPNIIGGTLGFSGFGGTGTVGTVNVTQGVISAGTLTSPTGILNTGNLTFTANGNYACKIGGTIAGANGHDQLNVRGIVNLNNARLVPIPWGGFRPAIGDEFMILKNDGTDAINGIFLDAPEGAVFGGALNSAFRITYRGGDGNDVVLIRVNRAPFDFDGDGKTDISTFRPSNGTWNITYSGSNSASSANWGLATDKLAPADYDGDNKTDLAVFRPSDGYWYIINSATNTVTITQFGLNGDIPLPNDFDGDGRADITVFRPSDGVWYELRSFGNQFFAQQFGLNGDIPQMVDFDGDGIGDLSVFRPSDGSWYFWQSSTNSFTAFPFGVATDKPVPADYDGDGKTDVAIFRATADPNQPDFYILLTGSFTFQGASWGVAGDIPTVADYDGDGKADIGVFRPGTNVWYLLKSTAGFGMVNFGQNGDKAIPSAFVP
ncbi:MAG: VCBS repeat-containing protein [Acidobacteriota bacterium]|nr:VCBS repeat-containing protein [Acidobacteriota bacterium]